MSPVEVRRGSLPIFGSAMHRGPSGSNAQCKALARGVPAFRAESDEVQLERQHRLARARFDVTPVIDRQYFNAVCA